jgi:hypothetical protein
MTTKAEKTERLSEGELAFNASLISGDCRPTFRLQPGTVREALIKARARTGLRLGWSPVNGAAQVHVNAHALNRKGEPTGAATQRKVATFADAESLRAYFDSMGAAQ